MMKKTKPFLLIFALIILGCKDEFLLETTNYKPIMVVDGMITNEPGPYTIQLSLDSPLPLKEKVQLEACMVSLYENSDKSEVLTETEPGIYVTSADGIQGIVGNNYSISIVTPEGKEYFTEAQEMKDLVEIDSLYAEFAYLEHEDYPFGLPGYQFYIDTKTTSNQENYFLWNMIETYQYTADYDLYAVIDEEGDWFYIELGQLPQYENNKRCWKTQNSGSIFTAKTSNLTVRNLSKQPLHFVGTDTKRLQERYSLLLRQYLIGEEAYNHWKSIEDQISQENFLVASQPYNITGNLKNKNNPDEIVYGYFTVASAIQKRIFVDRPNNAFYYEKCAICYEDQDCPSTPPIFIVSTLRVEPDGRVISIKGIVSEPCIDCTSKGGEITKPDFWIDK
ncbi:MAG: DUF4249 family protein [Bacteroidales bacterium]|nr:DUF4249 family protein [Bacteroidales bacterium]